MQNIFITILTIIGLIGCEKNNPSDSNLITSRDVPQYKLTIKGNIAIPLATDDPGKNIYTNYLKFQHHQGRMDMELPLLELSTPPSLGPAAPLESGLDSDEIKRRSTFWVEEQIKYAEKALGDFYLATEEVSSVEETRRTNDTAFFTYTAKMIATPKVDFQERSVVTATMNYVSGDTIARVPQNPVTIYSKEFSLDFKQSAMSDSDIWSHLESTKTTNNGFYTHDNYPYSPTNYFYSRNLSQREGEDFVDLELESSEELAATEIQKSYPEYHRLKEDGKLSFFLFYGAMSNQVQGVTQDEFTKRRTINHFTSKGFSQGSITIAEQTVTHLTKTSGDLEIEITIANGGYNLKNRAFEAVLPNYDVVMYSGHAGYGANISSSFTSSESYRTDSYQIIYLKGCNTLQYGNSRVIDAKSRNNGDTKLMNLDLIATTTSAKGWQQNDRLIESIIKGTTEFRNLEAKGTDAAESTKEGFLEAHSWNNIIKKINVSDNNHDGNFVLSAADQNCFDLETALSGNLSDCLTNSEVVVPTPLEIPASRTLDSTTITREIRVSFPQGTEIDNSLFSLDLVVEHKWIGQLNITLISPDSHEFNIHNNTGGSQDNIDANFNLAAFQKALDADPSGTWKIRIVNRPGFGGTLTVAGLNINGRSFY